MLKLILEYSKLAAALDTTRHHMSVNGVFIPQNHGKIFCFCLFAITMKFHHLPLFCKFSTCRFHQNFQRITITTLCIADAKCLSPTGAVCYDELTAFRF